MRLRLMKLIFTIAMLAIIVASTVLGGTFAHFVDSETSSGNVYEIGSLDLLVNEKNDQGAFWGEGIGQIIKVENGEENTIYSFDANIWNTGSGIDGDTCLQIKNVVEGPDSAGFSDDVLIRIKYLGQVINDWASMSSLENGCLPLGQLGDCESGPVTFELKVLESNGNNTPDSIISTPIMVSPDAEIQCHPPPPCSTLKSITFDLEFVLSQQGWETNYALEWDWDDDCPDTPGGEAVSGGGMVDTETSEGNYFEIGSESSCCEPGPRWWWRTWRSCGFEYSKSQVRNWLTAIDSYSKWLGDVTGDGKFNGKDMDIILGYWGRSSKNHFKADYLAQLLNLYSGRQDGNVKHDVTSVDWSNYLGLAHPHSATAWEIVQAIETKYPGGLGTKYKRMRTICIKLNECLI